MLGVGWLDSRRQQQRNQQQALSVRAAVLGAAMVVAGLAVGGAGLSGFLTGALGPVASVVAVLVICGGAALLALSLMALRRASMLSPLSEQGELAAKRWQAFGASLTAGASGGAPLSLRDQFDHYLPLATALGLAATWGRHFEKQGVSLPAWFKPLTATTQAGDLGAAAALWTVTDLDL